LTGQSRHAFFPVIAQLPPASALSAAIGGQVAGQSRKKRDLPIGGRIRSSDLAAVAARPSPPASALSAAIGGQG